MRTINKENIVQIRLPLWPSYQIPAVLGINNVHKTKQQKNYWTYCERSSYPQRNSPISIIIAARQTFISKRHVKKLYYSKRNAVKQISSQFCIMRTHQSWKNEDNPTLPTYKLKRPSISYDSHWYRFENINLKPHFTDPKISWWLSSFLG